MDFLRVQDGIAVEMVSLPDGLTPSDCYTDEVAAAMFPAGDAGIGWLFDGERFTTPPAAPEMEPAPAGPTIIPAANLFDRMTEEESLAIDTAMQKRALKFRGAWNAIIAGSDLRSDHDVWSALKAEIEKLYGDDRTTALLSPV